MNLQKGGDSEMLREMFMQYWYDFLLGLFFAGLGLGFRWIMKTVKQLVIENEAQKTASRAMLRDRIVQAYTYFGNKECWSLQSRESTFEMYEQYKKLGGNGSIAHLMESLRTLPIETQREEE